MGTTQLILTFLTVKDWEMYLHGLYWVISAFVVKASVKNNLLEIMILLLYLLGMHQADSQYKYQTNMSCITCVISFPLNLYLPKSYGLILDL